MSSLVITTGLCAAGVGVASAASRLRCARRAYRRTTALHEAMSDGWHAWFLGGFSSLAMGTQWLWAIAAWLLWTLAGVGLIGLGLRLFARA